MEEIAVGDEVWVRTSGTAEAWNLGVVEDIGVFRKGSLYSVRLKCNHGVITLHRCDIRTKAEHKALFAKERKSKNVHSDDEVKSKINFSEIPTDEYNPVFVKALENWYREYQDKHSNVCRNDDGKTALNEFEARTDLTRDYELAGAQSYGNLVNVINEAIQFGYKPIGSPFVNSRGGDIYPIKQAIFREVK